MVTYGQSQQPKTVLPTPRNVIEAQQHRHQPAAVGRPGCTYDCSFPPNKPSNLTQAIKAARWSSIAVIMIHITALVAFGFLILSQWVAAVFGIITGSALLGCFNKCFYVTAAILFVVGAILDIATVAVWMYLASRSDIDGNLQAFAIPPALGAIASLMASMAVCMAVANWEESDAPNVVVFQTGAIQIGQQASIAEVINTTVQSSYGQNGAANGAPSEYSSTV